MFFAPSWFFFFYITGAVSRLHSPLPPFPLKKKNNSKKQLDLSIANKMHLICPRDAGIWPGRHVK